MSNVVELPSDEKLYDQASTWIAKLDRGLNEEETKQLSLWLSGDKRRRAILFEMAELWDRMDSLANLSSLFDAPNVKEHKKGMLNLPLGLAASFFAATIGIAITLSLLPQKESQWLADNAQLLEKNGVYETAVGENSTILLEDGSELILNTGSLVSTHFTQSARLITLERGELFIKVAHDKSRPLTVKAQDTLVQAVGTAFNVEILSNNALELIVTDGEVLVAEGLNQSESQAAILSMQDISATAVKKGEKLIVGENTLPKIQLEEHKISADLSWQDGRLVFQGDSLESAVNEISRYTSTKFEFKNESIKAVRIAGLFKAGDVDSLLLALDKNFNIKHSRVEDTIILSQDSE